MNQIQSPAVKRQTALQRVLESRLVAALTFPHHVDRYLELLNPSWSVRDLRATVTAVAHETADSVTLTLRPNQLWQGFRPGQFVQLSVEIDGVRRTRCYSPANSIHRADGQIELTIKAHSWGFVSRHLSARIQPGMVVGLSQAQGDFWMPEARPERVLLISGGSGITPVMSMLRTLIDEGHSGRITFLHYALTDQDVIYGNELKRIADAHDNVDLIRVYTQEAGLGEAFGFFSDAQLQTLVPDFRTAETFLCGPPGLMDKVVEVWDSHAIAERLHKEFFTAQALPPSSTDAIEGDVQFARSERYVANDGRNLLEQAEGAGLTPESGCRMGICSTCTCRKVSGAVRNLQTGEISTEANENIRICVSVPVGTVTLDI